MIRRTRLALLAFLLPLALVATACPGGGGDDDDDDDDAATTPANQDACQIVWASADAVQPAVFDFFIVDADKSDFVSGTISYSVNAPSGFLYNEQALPSSSNPDPVPATAAVTTAGTFSLTLGNGTATGGTVVFSDSPGQMFYNLQYSTGTIGALVGTGGTMSFDGVWSDPDPDAQLTNGTGTAAILYLDSSLTLGVYGSYAVCYSAGATAATAQSRADETVRRVLRQISAEQAR